MAQSYQSPTNGLEVIPKAYASYTVQAVPSGLATTGVIAIIGEASQGPDFTQEQDLQQNAFGPSSLAQVVAKYGSGNIVNAFQALCVPSKDPNITGSPNQIIIVKTNAGGIANGPLTKVGGGSYGTLYARSEGILGNLINYQVVQATAETAPTTGAFTYCPAAGSINLTVRANGSNTTSSNGQLSLSANTTPAAFVSAINSITGLGTTYVTASGGVNKSVLTTSGSPTLALAAVGKVLTITYSINWVGTAPVAGDTLTIPVGSPFQDNGDSSQSNVGAYVITSASPTTIVATKVSDAGKSAGGGAVPGTITAPQSVSATTVTTSTNLSVWSPVTIANTSNSGNPIDGVGKTLEIADLGTGTDLLIRACYQKGTLTLVTWVQGTWAALPFGTPVLLAGSASTVLDSATEYSVTLNDSTTQPTTVSESWTAGGRYGLTIGYSGTSAVVTVTSTGLSTTVTGGSGSPIGITFAHFPTIVSVANYINAQPGYSCSVGSTLSGQLPSTNLDQVTNQPFASTGTAQTLNLKMDAALFFQTVSASALLQLGNPAARAAAGLPATTSTVSYFTGGTLGSTSNNDVAAALTALQACTLNFIVPLFSQDAPADAAAGLTDPSSSYTITSINAATLNHCLLMSETKYQKNRQCFCSYLNSFDNCLDEAANLASFRASLAFLSQTQVNTYGTLQSFQPWMGAALAAGMQAAGFYKAIVNKSANTSGVFMADGSYNPRNVDQVTQALQGGLLPIGPIPSGNFNWVSDQTTYGVDNNFVFNSIQAVYAADIIAVTTAQQMTQQFVGQSLADVSAPLAESAIEGIMANFLRLKLIAPSDGAPKGFQNLVVKIDAPVMTVSLQVFLATALYFVDINFTVAPVSQTAAS